MFDVCVCARAGVCERERGREKERVREGDDGSENSKG